MKKLLILLFTIYICFYTTSCVHNPGTMPPPNYLDPTYRTASQKLPETTALEKELRQTYKSLNATAERVEKAKKTVTNGRYAAEAAVKMIGQIKPVEDQISRLELEIRSISKIPQFRMLKPVAKGVTNLKENVAKIREKAEKLRDDKIKPAIKKMKNLEAKLAKLKTGLNLAATETAYAVNHINLLRNFVISQKYPEIQVRTLEALSKTTRYPVSPAQKALYEFDSACADLEKQVNAYKAHMAKLTSLKPGLDKVRSKMKPIDDKVKGIAKVLSKKLGFKIPLSKKEVSFTVRQVIEAPGKVLDIALKPLTKIAEKLLKPLTKNLKFDIKAPKELQKISVQLDAINRFSLNLDRPSMKFDSPVNTKAIENYRAALKKFVTTKTVNLSE